MMPPLRLRLLLWPLCSAALALDTTSISGSTAPRSGASSARACSCVPSSLCRPLDPQPTARRREQQVFLEGKLYNGSGNNGGDGVWPWQSGVTSVVVFGSGNDSTAAFEQILCEAHRHGARAILPCGVPRINATDNLSSAAFRQMWVNSSIERMWGGVGSAGAGWLGWDGCNLDIENHDLGARPGLTELVKELKVAMNRRVPGSHLSFDASGEPSEDARRNMVFNYTALSEHVDYFIPTFYDMVTHIACSRRSSGCSLPSPNSPLPKVQAELEFWLNTLKIDPSKLIMALPFYGYDAPCKEGGNLSECILPAASSSSSSSSSDTLVDQAMKGAAMIGYGTIINEKLPLSRRGVQWNATASSPYFDYPNATTGLRHRVYYDNPRSIAAKRKLAQRLGLGGISAWTADALPHSSDPAAAAAMWEAITFDTAAHGNSRSTDSDDLVLKTDDPAAALPPSMLYLGPCNVSNPYMQWRGSALTSPGAAGTVENVGAKLCLSTLSKDPATLGPCGAGAAAWLYNSTNLTLAVVSISAGSDSSMAGVCVDVHGGLGPELDLWACHPLPPAGCHAAGVCASDYLHQQLRYDSTTGMLSTTHIAPKCNAQCVTLGQPGAGCVPGQGGCAPAGNSGE
jgi:di-N-acetylchitobiase